MDKYELKKDKQLKENTLKMFRQTLGEMYEKKLDKQRMNSLLTEIKTIEDEIKDIDNELNKDCESVDKIVNTCDNESSGKSVYDNIILNIANKTPIEKKYRISKKKEKDNDFDYQEAISETIWIKKNKFIMTLPKSLNLPVYCVRYFTNCGGTAIGSKTLKVTLNDFIDSNGPLCKKLKNFYGRLQNDEETIEVEYLDNYDNLIYKEKYTGVKLLNYNIESMDYTDSSIRRIYLTFSYQDYIIE